MAKKLTELNGWELTNALVEIAEPLGNLAGDDKVWEVFKECTKRGVGIKQKDTFRFILTTYAKLIPALLGKEHKLDTVRILSVVEGKKVDELMKMNGTELLRDFERAFKEQLTPFFTKSVLMESAE